MNINLYKDWYLKTDPLNYTLYRKRVIDDPKSKNYGEEYEQIEGYHSTIEHALKNMCTKEIRACRCTTLNGLVREVRKLQDLIEGLIREIGADNVVENILKMQRDENPLVKDDKPAEEKLKSKRGRKKKAEK